MRYSFKISQVKYISVRSSSWIIEYFKCISLIKLVKVEKMIQNNEIILALDLFFPSW